MVGHHDAAVHPDLVPVFVQTVLKHSLPDVCGQVPALVGAECDKGGPVIGLKVGQVPSVEASCRLRQGLM
jgi:hypothetical protein